VKVTFGAEFQLTGKSEIDQAARAVDTLGGKSASTKTRVDLLNKAMASSSSSAGMLKSSLSEAESAMQGLAARGGPVASIFTSLGPAGLAAAAGMGAAAIAARAMVSAVSDAVARGGRLSDLSEQLGMSADSIQRLQYVASLGGNSLEQLATGVGILQKNMIEAPEKFERWGVSIEKLMALRPEQQLAEIAGAIQKIQSPAAQTAAAMDLLGKSGAQLLPTLKTDLAGAAAEADALGAVMSGRTVAAADALGDAGTKLGVAWTGLKDRFAEVVIQTPSLTRALEDTAHALGAVGREVSAAGPGLRAYLEFLLQISGARQMLFAPKLVASGATAAGAAGALMGGPFGDIGIALGLARNTPAPSAPAAGGGGLGMSPGFRGLGGAFAKLQAELQALARRMEAEAAKAAAEAKAMQEALFAAGSSQVAHLFAGPPSSIVEGGDPFAGPPSSMIEGPAAYSNPAFATTMSVMGGNLPAVTKAATSWDQQLQRLANTMQAMGSVTGRTGQKLAALTATIANIGGNVKDMKGGGFFDKLLGGLGIGASVVSFIGGLFGGGPSKAERAAAAKQAAEEAARAAEEARQNRIAGLGNAATSLNTFLQAGGSAQTGGVYAAGIFAGMVRETGNVVQALNALGPALQEIRKRFEETGESGSAALDHLLGMSSILDKTGMGGQISALQDLAKALGQGGIAGTPAIVGALAQDTTSQFHQLMGGGATAQDAFNIMQPMFQQLWEAQQKRPGSITDEGTLSLLQQAQDQGLVGDDLRTGVSATNSWLEKIYGVLSGGGGEQETSIYLDGEKVGSYARKAVADGLERGTDGRLRGAVRNVQAGG